MVRSCFPQLSFPQGSPITNVGDKVSGNPVSFSSGLLFVRPCMGKTLGFPIEDVGNDRGGIEEGGNDSGGRAGMTEGKWCGSASLGCHSRRFLAGIQSESSRYCFSLGRVDKLPQHNPC